MYLTNSNFKQYTANLPTIPTPSYLSCSLGIKIRSKESSKAYINYDYFLAQIA